MSRLPSSISRLAPLCRDANPDEGRAACRAIYHETGLIVINPEHLPWPQAAQARQVADQIYGKRKGGA